MSLYNETIVRFQGQSQTILLCLRSERTLKETFTFYVIFGFHTPYLLKYVEGFIILKDRFKTQKNPL